MKTTAKRIVRGMRSRLGLLARNSAMVLLNDRLPTQLIDVQRRIGIYLHALWDCDFVIKPSSYGSDSAPPFIKYFFIHVPNACYDFTLDGFTRITGLEFYRAACAHAAAHIIYSTPPFAAEGHSKWEKALISAIEDARVETLAIRQFPRLKQLWGAQHHASPAHNESAGDYLNRLARALLDECYRDDDPWIVQGRALFDAAENLGNSAVSRDIALTLAHSFRQRKIRFNSRADKLSAPYRDDNRYLWEHAIPDMPEEPLPPLVRFKLLLTGENVKETDEDIDDEPPLQRPIEAAAESDTYLYPEWDYRGQILTPSWVTLRERVPVSGDIKIVEDIVAENKHLISRLKNLLLAIKYKRVHRVRKLEEGEEMDINAAIRAQIELRQGTPPDSRIMMRSVRKPRDISVLVLLDLSNSTNDIVPGYEHTVLELSREVCVLFADAIETVGDPLAIHGFNSRGRNDVEYFRFKDFGQHYDDTLKARIAGMNGDRSTRIGAAIRHAAHHLDNQPSVKKLLMIITDGAPHDIDMPDPKYLRLDAKQAVNEARLSGIHTYCVGLDPNADTYISRIFGAKNYMVVDHVKSLPEKILLIYAALSQ